jgi:hypothetical protein
MERAASRRGVVRGAAWTAAAVTVVVATPNIAAASHGGPHASATASGSVTRADGNGSVFSFNTTLTSTGNVALTNPTVVVSWNGESKTFSLGSSLAAAQQVRLPAAGQTASFSNNAQGGTVTMMFYADATDLTSALCTLTFVNVNKGTTVTGS